MFLVQFRRLRRGVPEVVRTTSSATGNCAAALASGRRFAGTRHWSAQTNALRVMDDGGRTLLDWTVPGAAPPQRSSVSPVLPEPIH
jgi:hypothetical protein